MPATARKAAGGHRPFRQLRALRAIRPVVPGLQMRHDFSRAQATGAQPAHAGLLRERSRLPFFRAPRRWPRAARLDGRQRHHARPARRPEFDRPARSRFSATTATPPSRPPSSRCATTPNFHTAICYRVALAKWRLDFGEQIPTHENGKPRPTEDIMRDVNRALEIAVRRDPANWFWVHRRWKGLKVNSPI